MTDSLLNLDSAPDEPFERLMWLSGVHDQVKAELEAELRSLYFDLRLERRLDAALAMGLHSRKQILAWTRAENEARGRMVRWGDGL